MTTTVVTDIHGHEHTLPGPYTTIAAMKRANKELGRFYFEPDTMRFFDSRIEPRVLHGRLFITSEQFHGSQPQYDGKREWSVCVCSDDGDCSKLMDTRFTTYDDAVTAIVELVGVDQ